MNLFRSIFLVLSCSLLYGQDKQTGLFVSNAEASPSVLLKWLEGEFLNDKRYYVYRRNHDGNEWTKLNNVPLGMSAEMPAQWKGTDLEKLSQVAMQIKGRNPNPFLLYVIGKKVAEDNSFAQYLGFFYEDTQVEPDAKYVYRIVSVNRKTEKDLYESSPVSAGPFTPESPVESQVAVAGRRFVELGWKPEPGRYLGVNIYRSDNVDGPFKKINEDLIIPVRYKNEFEQYVYNDFLFVDTLVARGTTYYYKMEGQDYFGRPLASSAPVTVTTRGNPLARPQQVRAHQKSNGVGLEWNYEEMNIQGFNIFRSEGDSIHFVKISGQLAAETKSYLDTEKLMPHTPYFYRVSVKDNNEREAVSSSVHHTATDIYPPDSPMGLSAQISGKSIVLSWRQNTDADLEGYQVFRNIISEKDDGQFALLNAYTSTENAYYDPYDSINKGVYQYKVMAWDTTGNRSAYSSVLSITLPDVYAPEKPAIRSISGSDNSLIIQWLPGVDEDLKEWTLYRSERNENAIIVKALKSSTIRYSDPDVVAGNEYTYFLTATDTSGNISGKSNGFRAKVPKSVKRGQIQDVKIQTNIDNGSVLIAWPDQSLEDRTGFIVFRRKGEEEFKPLSDIITNHSFTDAKTEKGEEYTYRVKAIGQKGVIAESDDYTIDIKDQ